MQEAKLGVFLLLSTLGVSWAYPPVYVQPEQIHLAYGDPEDPTQMYVVWNTANDTQTSTVRYFAKGSTKSMTAEGVSRKFTDGGDERRVQFIHRVKVTGLMPGQMYQYMCGSNQGWSKMFSFTAMKSGSNWSPRFALYGDLGNINAQSLPRLQLETDEDMYDAILHVGDFAYDLNVDNARVGDQFMRQIEPIAANLPYMTCPGNHEMKYNFSNYKHRFVMPGDELSDRMFYSFNIGPAHIISLNTEYYFYIYYGIAQPIEQYRWLQKDLEEAAKPENRAKRPWIITMGHRPMYCSNDDKDDCTKKESIEAAKPENRAKRPWIITMGHRPMYCSNNNSNDCTRKESIIRTGVPFLHTFGLEKLFYKYGVDLALWAHEHSYERLWPVYDRQIYNGSLAEPYTNPGAPVHIITGSAGCQENHDNFTKSTAEWSAFRSDDYGYTRMTIHNASHLYMEQVSDDKAGKIIDRMWLKKDNHGPYPARKEQPEDEEKLTMRLKKKFYRMFTINDNAL